MSSKKLVVVILVLVAGMALGWAIEKQKVGIAGFVDMSADPDGVISTIVQNSLATVLQRQERFGVVLLPGVMTNLAQAREGGFSQKVDVVVFGSYRREGREFVVLVQIYDILENELRMSRLYRGEYSRNIFDTVDAIAEAASEEIKRAIPPLLTEEDIARAQAKRKEVYQPEEVRLRREMRLGVGMIGPVDRVIWERGDLLSGFPFPQDTWIGSVGSVSPSISLGVRLASFRVSLLASGMPWLPTGYWSQTETSSGYVSEPLGTSGIKLDHGIHSIVAVGGDIFWKIFSLEGFAGVKFMDSSLRNGDVSWENMGWMVGGGVSSSQWEVFLNMQVWPLSRGWEEMVSIPVDIVSYEDNNRVERLFRLYFPRVMAGGTYFFTPSLGASIASWYESGYTQEKDVASGSWKKQMTREFLGVSLEVIYRFQFGL